MMSPKQCTGIRIDEDLLAGLKSAAEADDRPVSYIVRQAIREYLETRGLIRKAERKRAATRKRP